MPRLRQDPLNVAALAATRQRLLAAACEEFCNTPFFETDTNKIARRASLSPGTFYKHFKDKVEIFAAAYEQLCEEESRAISTAVRPGLARGAAMTEIADAFALTLLGCRRHLRLIRLQAEILLHGEPRVAQAKQRARHANVAAFEHSAVEHDLQLAPREALFVHIHLMNSLADAIAGGEFAAYGISDQTAQAELRRQILACLQFDQAEPQPAPTTPPATD